MSQCDKTVLRPHTLARQGIGMTSLRARRRLLACLREQGITDENVLNVLQQTPRHLFIDPALAHKAYENTALPLDKKQTISQPFIVALMTQLTLAGEPPVQKVLEVGTGCGYQAAILSQLVTWVFTLERINSLLQKAQQRLYELGYRNISCLNADGFDGWLSNQPFDAIIVTAAPPTVPPTLLQQLRVGGRLVLPVGSEGNQHLRVITRTAHGYAEQQREPVRFVPMLNGRCA